MTPQKKWILPLLTLSLTCSFPTLPVQAVPRAVIKSCANPKVKPRPVWKQQAPSGAYSGSGVPTTSTAPAPRLVNQSRKQEALKIAPAEPPPMPTPSIPSSKPDRELDVHQAGKQVDKTIRKASEVYLSNDDSMSLASAQRLIYLIDNFLPLYRSEIRPHEFLNYFSFKTDPVIGNETFSVNFQLAPRSKGETLALAVQGKKLTKAERRPAVLTFILDKSGSMRAQGKMEYLKQGLEVMKAQLKNGDVINVVEFDNEVCNAMEGFLVGRDGWQGYDKTVKELGPRGSTNLHAGLVEGYKLAEKFHDANKLNRVILITDAIANTGELSPELMASISKYYDTKKIALSGIGVGLDFNDELLDTLTDQGKGAYLFLGIKDAIPRVFDEDFTSLLETIARNVHFKATFPKDVHLDVFYGEEVSTEKAKVQAIHYFANTSQLFLLDLLGKAKEGDRFQLSIEFENTAKNGQKEVETLSRSLTEIQANGSNNIAKARLIMAFADLLEQTALPGKRPYRRWNRSRYQPTGKDAKTGKKKCGAALSEMKKQSGIYSDADTAYVTSLAEKYCSRF